MSVAVVTCDEAGLSYAAYLEAQWSGSFVLAHSRGGYKPLLRQCPDGSLCITFWPDPKGSHPYDTATGWPVHRGRELPSSGYGILTETVCDSAGNSVLADTAEVLRIFNALCKEEPMGFEGYNLRDGLLTRFHTNGNLGGYHDGQF